jgi:hypothetical protein
MKTLFINIFILFIFISFTSAQDAKFTEWDTDKNNTIERSEFETNFVKYYISDKKDRNEENYLDKDQYYEFLYSVYDENDDALLNEEEWKFMHAHVFNDYLLNDDFTIYDLNEDKFLGYDEYNAVVENIEFFEDSDEDGNYYVSVSELANAVYDQWNMDGDRGLTKVEFDAFDRFFFN